MDLFIKEFGYTFTDGLEHLKVNLPWDFLISFAIKELEHINVEQLNFKVKVNILGNMEPRVFVCYIKVNKQDLKQLIMDYYKLVPFTMDIMADLADIMAEKFKIVAISIMAIAGMSLELGFDSKINLIVAMVMEFKSLMEFNSGFNASFKFEITQLECMAVPILICLG